MLCDNASASLRLVSDVYYSPLNSCIANTAVRDCCGAMLMTHNKKKIIPATRIFPKPFLYYLAASSPRMLSAF